MKVTLLDGGMGQELVHRAGDAPTPLWSTQVMLDYPGLVAEVHQDFEQAGATVATSNTYAIHRDRLALAGIELQFAAFHERAIAEMDAVSTRKAGSIGPLVASYQPGKHPPHSLAVPLYREVVRLLAPHFDVILFETVASVAHARAALDATTELDLPIWMAFTVDDEDGTRLRSGEPLEKVMSMPGFDAILANCSAPEVMPQALDIFSKGDRPFGAYANGFTKITKAFLGDAPTVDALTKRQDFTPEVYAAHALAWVEQGATIVGGCCEVSPAHIKAVADRLRAAGHEIV